MMRTHFHVALFGSLLGACCMFACSRHSLCDNPDIRPYIYLAKRGVHFDCLMHQLPCSIIEKKERCSMGRAIPSYPGNVYYLSDATNRVYWSSITIKQKGRIWSYRGTFYFDRKDYCFAVQYEKWARSPSPIVPYHEITLQADSGQREFGVPECSGASQSPQKSARNCDRDEPAEL
jgi:hypothetical protein